MPKRSPLRRQRHTTEFSSDLPCGDTDDSGERRIGQFQAGELLHRHVRGQGCCGDVKQFNRLLAHDMRAQDLVGGP